MTEQEKFIIERIQALLKEQKKTKKELCDYLGVSPTNFGNWASGRNISFMKYLHAIAKFFNVSIEYLSGESDEQKSPSNEELKVALFGGDAEVTDEMWDEVMKYAEYIKSKYNKA